MLLLINKMFDKREDFSGAAIAISIVLIVVISLLLTFHYYIIKTLGFKWYMVLLVVLTIISGVTGYFTNCRK